MGQTGSDTSNGNGNGNGTISERTAVRFKIGAIGAGIGVISTVVWALATWFSGISRMQEDMAVVREFIENEALTQNDAEVFVKLTEALNNGTIKFPPFPSRRGR